MRPIRLRSGWNDDATTGRGVETGFSAGARRRPRGRGTRISWIAAAQRG